MPQRAHLGSGIQSTFPGSSRTDSTSPDDDLAHCSDAIAPAEHR
jgi:hypothetical protein